MPAHRKTFSSRFLSSTYSKRLCYTASQSVFSLTHFDNILRRTGNGETHEQTKQFFCTSMFIRHVTCHPHFRCQRLSSYHIQQSPAIENTEALLTAYSIFRIPYIHHYLGYTGYFASKIIMIIEYFDLRGINLSSCQLRTAS